MSSNPNPPKKQLRISAPFAPVQQGVHQQQPPYGNQNGSYYPQQQYVPQQQQQTYQPQQNDLLGNISLNGGSSTQSSLQAQPEQQQPKTKKKLQLTKTTNQFIPDNSVEKKLEEELQKKKQEEEQKQKESRKPRPYTKSELAEKLNEINDFSVFFLSQEWIRLKERQNCGHKEIFVKAQQPRKDGKSNTQSYKSGNQRDSQRPQQQQPQIQPFNKGTNIQQVADQPEKKQPSLIIHRVSEDIATKSKKDQMKVQAEAFIQQLNQTPEEKDQITRDIKYRLNQLAPDNFDAISSIIQKLIVANTTQNELTYLNFLAERIIEKSQTEPKYRKLYTKLCQNLASEPTLVGPSKKSQKNQSLFKAELLNQVQKVFRGRKTTKQEDLSHMKPDEKEQYHLIRKSKIMGNVRFIGDLFSMNLLPFLAIEHAIQELISEYLEQYTPTGENSEESIEGFIELIDQIGPKYKVILGPTDQDTIKDLENHFNGEDRKPAETHNCFQKFEKKLSMEIVQKIFELLKTNYALTQRIQMLIENVLDRKRQGWKDHYNKQEQAQSVKTIQQEQEKEIIEQNYTQSKAKGRKPAPQEVMYVEKYPSSSSQQQQKQQPAFDLNEIMIFVNGTFNMDAQVQNDKLREELKRISSSGDAIQKFFEKFFECMLDLKYVKRSTARASLVFELLMMKEAGESHVKKALQKALNEDKLYDLADSPAAKELFVDIISFFINESDQETLKKFYVKPLNEVEDFSAFMVKVSEQLIEKYPDEGRLEVLSQYFGTLLGYQIQ